MRPRGAVPDTRVTILAVALGLLGAAEGLTARPSVGSTATAASHSTVAGVVTLVVLLLAGVVLAGFLVGVFVAGRRRRKRGPDDHSEPEVPRSGTRLAPLLAVALAVVVVAVPAVLLAARLVTGVGPATTAGPAATASASTPAATPAASSGPASSANGPVVIVVVCLAGLALTTALASLRGGAGENEPIPTPSQEEESRETYTAAIHAARRALEPAGDARRLVISAYAAMEAGLAARGITRGMTQTPDDLLAEIAALAPTAAAPAGEVTEVFQLARFSSDPVTDADLGRARRAVDGLASALERRR
jgi:hypothetical protein